MSRWRDAISDGRCGEAAPHKSMSKKGTTDATLACAAQTYFVEMDFDNLQDESEREHLKHLSTSFHLEPADVDRLKSAARQILADSVEFQKLIADMQ